MLIIDARVQRENLIIDRQRASNHHLASLIAYAQHDPKNMPKFEANKSDASSDKQAEIEDLQVRAFLKALAAKGKNKPS